jgi:transmembrane sensor
MKTKDFLSDPGFIKWVNHPDRESDAYWKNWMAAHPEHLPQLKLARELLLRIRYNEIEPRPGAKGRILENILTTPVTTAVASVPHHGRHDHPSFGLWGKMEPWTRVAAILAVGLLVSWLAYIPKADTTMPVLAEEIKMIHKRTAPGEKLQLTLPDGTRVWMNSVSELEFPVEFNEEERVVRLSGEAYFEVEKDSIRPFRVHAEGTVTTAVGTSFNVSAKNLSRVNISLLTGRVKVEAPLLSEGFYLDPGQDMQFEPEIEKISIQGFNAGRVIAWKEGKLIFTEASLSEAVKKLEEWYGVSIHLENAKAIKWRYSGEYHNQTLDNVLNSMAHVQKFRYKIKGNKVEFKF